MEVEKELLRDAIALHKSGRIIQAKKQYEKILLQFPNSFDGHHLLGLIYYDLKNYKEALAHIEQAIKINPKISLAYLNRGVALHAARRLSEAMSSYDTALFLQPASADVLNNRGLVLLDRKDYLAALSDFEKSLAIRPNYAEAYNNKALALKHLQRVGEAVECFQRATQLMPDYKDAYYNLGNLYLDQGNIELAIKAYEDVYKIQPTYPYLLGNIALLKANICDWRSYETDTQNLNEHIMQGNKVSLPFPMLALSSSRLVQKRVSEIYCEDKLKFSQPLTTSKKGQTEKIVLGYFSASLFNHPGANLSAELFELHDRRLFKVIAFSFGAPPHDTMNQRLRRAFDLYIDVDHKGDAEIADLAKSLGVDIAIDLRGFTTNARTGIFSFRPAPIQVNYLGYPGTMGASFIDYIIADPNLIPISHQADYSEKIAYLPFCYQPNDRKKVISEKCFKRSELGLPEDGFVYCCFNNNYKITPETFEIWMRILKKVNGSVLWLLSSNRAAELNLRKEANDKGVDPSRIIFADRVNMSDHLARHRCADLFLDTLPYNAHTTSSDALWAGLPLLTRVGETFAGRVSASLLKALNLSELITTTAQEYEHLAITLAEQPETLKKIMKSLENNRNSAPLFDTPLYTKHLEAAYCQMVENFKTGHTLDHIHIKP
ncbi:MAG: tetratricopeptide repeat protein [Hyphomicrobium sp.]